MSTGPSASGDSQLAVWQNPGTPRVNLNTGAVHKWIFIPKKFCEIIYHSYQLLSQRVEPNPQVLPKFRGFPTVFPTSQIQLETSSDESPTLHQVAAKLFASSADACATRHACGVASKRPRSCRVASSDAGCRSTEVTGEAPSRRKAKELRPEPQPRSKTLRPFRSWI